MKSDARQRLLCDKTKIGRTGRWLLRSGRKFLAVLMQIDFLGAKGQRFAPLAKGELAHAEHAGIKGAGGAEVAHRQYQVVEVFYLHIRYPIAVPR